MEEEEDVVAVVDVVVSTAQPFANSKPSWFLLLRAGLYTWADSVQVAAAAEDMLGQGLGMISCRCWRKGYPARMQAQVLLKLGNETCGKVTCVRYILDLFSHQVYVSATCRYLVCDLDLTRTGLPTETVYICFFPGHLVSSDHFNPRCAHLFLT